MLAASECRFRSGMSPESSAISMTGSIVRMHARIHHVKCLQFNSDVHQCHILDLDKLILMERASK